MGFFSSLGSTLARVGGDVMTFGTNELLGDPIGKFADSILNPSDPNAAIDSANAEQLALAQENMAMEKEFAQNGIQWKVADAAKAGISPLAALGAVDPAYSPVTAAFQGPVVDNSIRNTGAAMLANMGQDLFRSRLNAMSDADRASQALDLKAKAANVDLVESQAKLARLNIARMSAAPPNPAIPSASQQVLNADGSISILPSDPVASRTPVLGSWRWEWANEINPALQGLRFNLGNEIRSSAPRWAGGN